MNASRWLTFSASIFVLLFWTDLQQPCTAQSLSDSANTQHLAAIPTKWLGPSPFTPVFDSSDSQATPQKKKPITERVEDRDQYGFPARLSTTAINFGNKHFNVLFGGIERGAGVVFGGEVTTADSLRWVELRFQAMVSTSLYQAYIGDAYFKAVGDENTHADVWFRYLRRRHDNFFGIGPTVDESLETNYSTEERSYNATLYHDFSKAVRAGLWVSVSNSNAVEGSDDQDPPIGLFFSGSPFVIPITRWAPGLDGGAKLLSYGVFGIVDRRNNDAGLTKGFYASGRVGLNDGLEKENRFSDFGWLQFDWDVRGYIPLGGDRTSLALRAYEQVLSTRGGSQIPFYYLSKLGGNNWLRGYDNFRYYTDNMLLFSAEIRRTVWVQKEDRGLDINVWSDVGQGWGDSRSKTNPFVIENDQFDSSNWRASFGGGVTYRFNKGLAFRVDFASSYQKTTAHFNFSRGF